MKRKKAVRLGSGYAYKYTGLSPWKTSPDDDWEIVVIDGMFAEIDGQRRIDGTLCNVYFTSAGIFARRAYAR
jgi:hypothetical protein